MFNIFINNNDYSIYLLDNPVVSGEFIENTMIGNVASMKLSISLNNNNRIFNFDLLSKPFIVKDGSKNIGVFYALEKPERMTKTLNLELYDNVFKTDVPYNSKLVYPCKLKDQLDEMATILSLSIDYSSVDVKILNRIINFYDNEISVRQHLMMIAEISACNVFSTVDGNGLKFIKINPSVKYEIDNTTVEQFDVIEEYKVSKVCFYGGIDPLHKGTDDFNSYRLADDNMYIENQSQIDYIYESLKNMSFYSSDALKIVALDGLQLGDVVNYKEHFKFIVLNLNTKYFNGAYNIQEISGKQKTRTEETIHEEITNSAKIKRLKITTDQNKQSLEILAKEQDGLDEKFAKLEIDTDGIKQEVKETTEKVESLDSQNAEIYYYLSTSNTSTIGGAWSTAQPTWTQGKYIWQKTKYTFANGTTKETSPVCVTGNEGSSGNGVSSIVAEYYLSTSKTTQENGSWLIVAPTWSTGKYMWTRSKIVYTNGTVSYTNPVCESSWEAINDLEIGGRNLLTKTKDYSTSKGTGTLLTEKYNGLSIVYFKNTTTGYVDILQWMNVLTVTPNTDYTASFCAKGKGDFISYLYRNGYVMCVSAISSEGKKTIAQDGAITHTLTSEWKRYWITWKTSPSITGNAHILLGRILANTEIWIAGCKFEQGNKATAYALAQEDIDQAIDDIDVGGRNLALNTKPYEITRPWCAMSNSTVSGSITMGVIDEPTALGKKALCWTAPANVTTTSGIYNATPVLTVGKTYSWSVWIKASKNVSAFRIGCEQGGTLDVPLTTSWQEFTYTFSAKTYSNNAFIFYAFGASGLLLGDKIYIHSLMVVEGNRCGTWCEAPEDTDYRITTEVKTLTDKQTSFDVLLTGITGRVSNTEQTITTTRNDLNNLQIGGRNLLWRSAISVDNLALWNKVLVTATIVKENNFNCFKVVPTGNIADQGLSSIMGKVCTESVLYPNRTYCYSIWCKTTTNQPVALFSIMHFQTTNSNGPHHKKNEKYNVSSIVANTWTRLYVTFEVTEQCFFTPFLWYLKTGTTYFFYGFKVEEGTRPTDWTPAPEDIDKSIDDLDKTITATKSQISSLVLDYNGFKTSVSDTYTTKTEFDGLSIGGRNLIKHSAISSENFKLWAKSSTITASLVTENFECFKITTDATTDTRRGFWGSVASGTCSDKVLYPNRKYCYSMWCKTDKAQAVGLQSIMHFQTPADTNLASPHNVKNVKYNVSTISPNEWTLLYCTFEVTAQCLFIPHVYYLNPNQNYFVHGFKVEEGTRPTDWTPAPEDIDADIKLVDGKFVNYSTTTQMNSAITQTSKDITQAVSNTYATLSNLGGLSTRVASAESKLTSSALITTISSGLSGGSALTTTKYTMDLTGLHIKGGGIDISNNAGTKVLYADVNGNLVMNNLTAKYGSFEGTITSTGPQGHWARVDGGIVSVGKNNIEYGKMVASWEASNPNIHYVALVADESSEELHIGADTGNNSNYPYYKMKAKKTLSVGEYRHDFVESVFAWTLRTTALYLGERSGNYYGTIGRNGTTIVCYNKAGTEFMFSSDTAWATMTHGPIEMYAPQPYIDFHFANSGADYSTRIICHGYGQMGYYGSWNALSDRRKKRNIMSLDDRYIDLLMRLDPCKFIYQYNSQIFDKYTLGYIAQDVTQAIKDVGLEKDNLNIVTYDETNDTYSMSYNDIEPIHTLAIQKLMKGFYELKNENANLKQRLEQLEKTRRA